MSRFSCSTRVASSICAWPDDILHTCKGKVSKCKSPASERANVKEILVVHVQHPFCEKLTRAVGLFSPPTRTVSWFSSRWVSRSIWCVPGTLRPVAGLHQIPAGCTLSGTKVGFTSATQVTLRTSHRSVSEGEKRRFTFLRRLFGSFLLLVRVLELRCHGVVTSIEQTAVHSEYSETLVQIQFWRVV